jgi:hypothetical protein
MVLYTGHVTAGGSVCVEALTQTGTAGGWRRTFTVEGVVTTVLINMIDVEPVRITTGHRQQRPPPPPPPPPSARGARDLTARPPARPPARLPAVTAGGGAHGDRAGRCGVRCVL